MLLNTQMKALKTEEERTDPKRKHGTVVRPFLKGTTLIENRGHSKALIGLAKGYKQLLMEIVASGWRVEQGPERSYEQRACKREPGSS